jgi:RHS repeat-associated protein
LFDKETAELFLFKDLLFRCAFPNILLALNATLIVLCGPQFCLMRDKMQTYTVLQRRAVFGSFAIPYLCLIALCLMPSMRVRAQGHTPQPRVVGKPAPILANPPARGATPSSDRPQNNLTGKAASTDTDSIVLGFDQLQCEEYVNGYYAGGFGSLGSGPGPNYGVPFSTNALSATDNSLCPVINATNEPSFPNSVFFLSGSAATMNVPAGFSNGFSFYYAAPYFTGFINVWSGLNATGILLTTLNLPLTGGCDEEPNYCVWNPIGITFSGVAQSIDFGGSANYIAFDSITLGAQLVVNPGKATGDPSNQPGSCTCGDPISIGTGNLLEEVTDYQTSGQNKLAYTRYYNSLGNLESFAVTLGAKWRSSYDRYIRIISSTVVTAERADGQEVNFNLVGSTWTPDSDVDLELTQSGSTWVLMDKNDTIETYTAINANEAVLNSIQARDGYTQTLARNASQQLTSVTDSYQRTLTLAYQNGLVQTVTTPDSLVLNYGYTQSGGQSLLTSVTYSTSPATSQTYLYENTSLPFFLTGVIDENGQRYETWTYDSFGRALSSQQGSGANLTNVVYNDNDGSRTVTNALGQQTLYKFTVLQGIPKLTEADRVADGSVNAATELFTYDSNGYPASRTDWNGNLTSYVNDAHGQPTTVNQAAGSTVARKTTISYDPTWVHEPHQLITPGLTSTFVYDSHGNPTARTDEDTTATTAPYSTNGQVRTTAWTWSSTGEQKSIKRPRTDVASKTSFTYDASGTLVETVDALGHTTKVTAHSGGGLPETIVDSNGVTTTLAYDARLNLHTRTLGTKAGKLTTTWSHDAANNVTSIELPDSSKLIYSYDAAHRLTKMADLFNNSMNYTLDALGDRTLVEVEDASSTVTRKRSTNFDTLGRVLQDIGGEGQTTSYTYDANGNTLTVAPPSPSGVTAYTYDALSRRSTATNPSPGGTTTIAYDAHDRVLSIRDANGHTTSYVYNGFGDRIETASPDSGITVYRYDPNRNLTQSIKPGPLTVNMSYDAEDRPLTTTYPADSTLNVSRNYDQTGHGFGVERLTSVTDQPGSLSLTYDERGNVTDEARNVTASGTLLTGTAYDAAGRVSGIDYPSGLLVVYGRDVMGRVTSVNAQLPGAESSRPVATTIAYRAFGPEAGLIYGNGVKGSYLYDLDYRATTRADKGTRPVQDLTYSYYPNDSVEKITDSVNVANTQSLAYDAFDRLISATSGSGGYGVETFNWDSISNITAKLTSGVNTAFSYASGTNRLTQALDTGGMVESVASTAAGNLSGLAIGGTAMEQAHYNQANELASVTTPSSAATYKFDFTGQRLLKSLPGEHPVLYQYGVTDGAILSENDLNKGQTADYIYLNGRPVAEVNPSTSTLYFTHTDRLGTPQKLTDSTQATTWSALYDPFGSATFGGTLGTQSLRLPGQYFDPETGLYHNGFRDYSQGLTRYIQSDPAGLQGGPNTFAYGAQNPLKWIDMSGLYPVIVEVFPDGTQYLPDTLVKNSAQAKLLGLPIGTAVPIAIPPGINPQALVNKWGSGAMFNGLGEFAWTWRERGPNDYKRISPIYDAYGNFEYGATGEAAGFSIGLLQFAANAFHGGTNNPINTADIQSGFSAIAGGSELCVTNYTPSQ